MNWRRFLHRDQADAEQREELEHYLEVTTREYIERGLDPAAARTAARRKLGNPTLIREDVYRMNTLLFLEDLLRDARHALRMLRGNPGFSIVALLSLALGIGANTALFSVANAILLRPLAYPEAGSLIGVANRIAIQGQVYEDTQLTPSMFAAARDHAAFFEQFGVWTAGAATLAGQGEPQQLATVIVTAGVLPALGVPPQLGRWFSKEEDSPASERTVLLTYGYWQRQFGGDPAIVGRTINLDFLPHRVIGVMPREFRFLNLTPDLFVPQRFPAGGLSSDVFMYNGLARLRPGSTIGAANRDLARVWVNMGQSQGVSRMLEQLKVEPNLRPLKQDVIGNVGSVLGVLMGALGLVLLLVCANVANLVLVRAQARRQEFAIRAALGAGWGRIARELLVESLTLGSLGGLFGLALAWAGLRALVAFGPASLPRLHEISLDGAALGFALACSVGASLLFGLAAVLRSGDPARLQNARGATHNARQLLTQNALVVTQIGLAFVLLVASGLMIRTFVAIHSVNLGFTHPEQIQTIRLAIPETLVADADRVLALQREITRRLAALPGVTAAGFASALPLETGHRNGMLIGVEGQTYPGGMPPNRLAKSISPGILAVQGTRLLAGRDFTWDDASAPFRRALVSEGMALENWGEPARAIGKRIRPGRAGDWIEVVGVVEDVRADGATQPAPPTVYFSIGIDAPPSPATARTVRRSMTFALRTSRAGTEALVHEVSDAVHAVHPSLPLADVRTLAGLLRGSLARTSFALVLLGIAGSMALTLALIGVYGVLAFAVAQRRREVGIRLALGAEPRLVKWLFVRRGLLLNLLGGLAGFAAARALSPWVSSLLYGVAPADPLTYGVAALVVLCAAAAASYLPARQAAAVDPIETLRQE